MSARSRLAESIDDLSDIAAEAGLDPAAARDEGLRVAVIPSRVSQHHPGPGPSRPVAAYPARRQRARIGGSRSGSTCSARASRS